MDYLYLPHKSLPDVFLCVPEDEYVHATQEYIRKTPQKGDAKYERMVRVKFHLRRCQMILEDKNFVGICPLCRSPQNTENPPCCSQRHWQIYSAVAKGILYPRRAAEMLADE